MILCIIQARLGSRRLKGKVLKLIGNQPLIYYVYNRIKKIKLIDKTVVATCKNNKKLLNWLNNNYIESFIGSENNVLKRFYFCSKKYNPEYVVRITADDPLKDPTIIKKAIKLIIQNKNIDYCSNTILPSFPLGLDIEVFKFSALKRAYKMARTNYDKEHVTSFIYNNDKIFKLLNFKNNINLSNIRLTIDTKSDLLKIRKIFKFFKYNPYVNIKKVLNFLNEKNIK
jgi:spore coat polysaccharide biosynthesis protein SpsF